MTVVDEGNVPEFSTVFSTTPIGGPAKNVSELVGSKITLVRIYPE